MIKFATLNDLRTIGGELLAEGRSVLMKRATARSPTDSTFLSHSTSDVDLIPAVIKILENHGGKVYIDKKDETLPPYTSRETALSLRRTIAVCRTFILFAARNSKESRWMPWELGVSDGIKQSTRTAIFPAVDTALETHWTEQEYLGIHDRVVWGDLEGHNEPVWMVLNQERNTASTLSSWLRA